jgi:hypothetical protein
LGDDPLVIWVFAENERAKRAANAYTGPGNLPVPGWLVFGLFVRAADGEPTCVDYRVRAFPNMRDLGTWQPWVERIGRAMRGDHSAIPVPDPVSGGIPRYVFERASQARLLEMARERLRSTPTERARLTPNALAIVDHAAGPQVGRPPQRSLAEKLRILKAVENAYNDGEPSLERIAADFHMSRSSLRDLLSWARRDATPRLFTTLGHGRRGGEMTQEAKALFAQIDKEDVDGE